jgi:hypothetical protein
VFLGTRTSIRAPGFRQATNVRHTSGDLLMFSSLSGSGGLESVLASLASSPIQAVGLAQARFQSAESTHTNIKGLSSYSDSHWTADCGTIAILVRASDCHWHHPLAATTVPSHDRHMSALILSPRGSEIYKNMDTRTYVMTNRVSNIPGEVAHKYLL